MYLPENDTQMFDILSELRVYAASHKLHGLAETLDDAMLVMAVERRRIATRRKAVEESR